MKNIKVHLTIILTALSSSACHNDKGSAPSPSIPTGTVTTFAGSGVQGGTNANATAASFYYPFGIASDASGNIYVGDQSSQLIRKITPNGTVSTLAGSYLATGANNATGTSATFFNPGGVAVDASGNVYVADVDNNQIRKITSGGLVTTLAGNTTPGSNNANGIAASFRGPYGVAVDASGNVYVADTGNNLIRKITPSGDVTTLAGSGNPDSTNGTGTAASFNNSYGIAVDASGNVYVADSGNNLIRKITPTGKVTTLAGSGVASDLDGTGIAAAFYNPRGIALDASGNIYVADTDNQLIRKVTSVGVVTTLAGSGQLGNNNGQGTNASFRYPLGITADHSGYLYVADVNNSLIRKIKY